MNGSAGSPPDIPLILLGPVPVPPPPPPHPSAWLHSSLGPPQTELITPTPSFSHHSILFLQQMEFLSRCITVNRMHLSPYRL